MAQHQRLPRSDIVNLRLRVFRGHVRALYHRIATSWTQGAVQVLVAPRAPWRCRRAARLRPTCAHFVWRDCSNTGGNVGRRIGQAGSANARDVRVHLLWHVRRPPTPADHRHRRHRCRCRLCCRQVVAVLDLTTTMAMLRVLRMMAMAMTMLLRLRMR